jgi:hypothetical protein
VIRYFDPGATVTLHRRRVLLATATVVEHTDDSDQVWTNVEQWLRLTITEAYDPRIRVGPMTLRRDAREMGDNGWQPRSHQQIGRVRVSRVANP